MITNQFTVLHEGRHGTLWIGTHRGGLLRCQPGQPPHFKRFPALERYHLGCLCQDRNGTPWIGTDVGTWTVTDGKCEPRRDAPINERAICQDGHDKLWFAASIWMTSKPPMTSSPAVQPQPGLFRLHGSRFNRLGQIWGNDPMNHTPRISIVDDHAAVQRALNRLCKSAAYLVDASPP